MSRGRPTDFTADTVGPLLDIAALAARRIPFLKIGKFIRFELADVAAWIAQQRIGQL